MKKQIASILTILGFVSICVTPSFGDDLERMAGKWSLQKTNDDGQRYTQQVEIKKNKFTYKVTDREGDTQLYAEGEFKLDKAGALKVVTFSSIKGGKSPADIEPTDDTYTAVYKFEGDSTFLLVMNFDKDREGQKPSLEVYHKIAPAQK